MSPNPESLDALAEFFARAPAASRAVRPLSRSARIGLELDEGPAAFAISDGVAVLTAGAPGDPDFTLRLPAAAVARLCAHAGAGVGELGLIFFALVLEPDPSLRVGVRVHVPTSRLLAHGYLAVLALGGPRVLAWLVRRGLGDARAVIERLRRR